MLPFSTHDQNAHKDCLEREHRILGFVANGSTDGSSEEEDDFEHVAEASDTGSDGGRITDTREKTSRRILSQESAANISHSPPVILSLLETEYIPFDKREDLEELVRMENRDNPQEGDEAIPPGRIPARIIVDYIKKNRIQADVLYKYIQEQLNIPEQAVVIGHELEQSVQLYRDIEQIHDCSPATVQERIDKLDETLPEEQSLYGMSHDEIRAQLGIDMDSPEFSEEPKPLVIKLLGKIGLGKTGKIIRSLADRVHNMRHRKLRRKESDSIDELESHLHSLKQAVDNTLQTEAQALYDARKNRLDARFQATKLHTDGVALMQKYGINHGDLARSVIAPSLELPQRILRKPDDAREGETHDVAPETDSEEYFSYARTALDDLRKIREWEAHEREEKGDDARHYEDLYLEAACKNHVAVIQWARKTAPRLTHILGGWTHESDELLRNLLKKPSDNSGRQKYRPDLKFTENELRENIPKKILVDLHGLMQKFGEKGEPPLDKYEELLSLMTRMNIGSVNLILDVLEKPQIFEQEMRRNAEREEIENTRASRESVRTHLEAVRERLLSHKALQHTVSRTFDILNGFKARFNQASESLDLAEQNEKTAAASARNELNKADELTSRLEDCAQLLDGVMGEDIVVRLSKEDFEKEAGGPGRAAFMKKHERYEGKILINREEEKPSDVPHEQGHALLHILTNQTGLFVGLHLSIHELIANDVPEEEKKVGTENRSFTSILIEQEEEWGIVRNLDDLYQEALEECRGNETRARTVLEQKRLEYLMDELMNQYATWVDEGKPPNRSENALILFKHLDKKFTDTGDVKIDESKLPDRRRLAAFQTGTGEGGTPIIPAGESDGEESEKATDINKQLRDVEQNIHKIKTLYESYPEYQGILEPHYEDSSKAFDEIKKGYENGETPLKNVISALKFLGEYIDPIIKKVVNKVSAQKLNLTDEAITGRFGWRAIARNVQFLSIMDVVEVFKQTWEDLSRIWKRRAEAKQATFGEGITDWIPNKTPYAGRLKNEFRKRMHASELEEVNHWKEALKESDSYALQNLLGRSANKDQVRAIFELLSERGRLDWGDDRMWKTLNTLSKFSMPIEACNNSDILRDKWIQKLIADIWDDKDHYFNWRQANDGGIKSGKDKFTPTVDQLANVSGGLNASLKNMLQTYDKFSKTPDSMPEEVNPHLYEEVIHYAMRMGKMTMEQKFFYLIQGVRYGLLSIDRIRVLAGDGGGILNTFPFIDFFYQKNNSIEYLRALGKRLDQSKDRFEPGLKTTMFVRMEIAREEAVKQRLRKGVSKRGEEIDHDDIPYFLPELEYSGVVEWFANMSGSRQKLSKEALKNSYVGYSMKFKTFAALAHLDRKHIQRFSNSDVKNMAETVGAYICADNMLTKNGFDSDSRPWLSTSEINSQIPVMANGKATVGKYRDNLQEFTQAVLEEFLRDGSTVWDEINASVGIAKSAEGTSEWLTRKDFAGKDPHSVVDPTRAKKIFDATGKMIDCLTKAMLSEGGGEKFKGILLKMSEQDSGNFFVEDGAVPGAFTNGDIEKLYIEREQATVV